MVGVGETVNVYVWLLTQFAVLVPTTLIVLVVVVVPVFTPVTLTVEVAAPLLQEYVFAPEAVNVALAAEHIVAVGAGVIVKDGSGLTVNVTVAGIKLVHEFEFVPVTLYTVVVVGLAVGLAMFAFDKEVDGVHV